ncbi:hypothetical protein XCR1_1060064 [Xenorhabdus cabanillasii JM26]|uniref:Uncharacterized protein n=1 Tax=Xenorhabdus cabanillasii JM26 TaxID=1427517 RepID=W1IN04_9GAMM|nr:hypothetical protein XCR1_1060064 [Xenorhabdus cabanillasii JM26]
MEFCAHSLRMFIVQNQIMGLKLPVQKTPLENKRFKYLFIKFYFSG